MTREAQMVPGARDSPKVTAICSVNDLSEVATRFANLESSLSTWNQNKDSGLLSEGRI